VATRHATRRIRDGDWVTIDGTEGRVELAAVDVAVSVSESEGVEEGGLPRSA
jgi:hypothetical protein